MDTNTEKVILCWVLVNQSVPVGHTILTLDWKEQGRGREAGDKKNWNRKKNMAGFIPKVVVESLCVCASVMKRTLSTQDVMALPLQCPLPRSQKERKRCNCTEDNRTQKTTIHEIST